MTSDKRLTAAGFSLTERLAVASLLRQVGDRRLLKRLQKRACSCDGKVTWLPGILPFFQLLPVVRVDRSSSVSATTRQTPETGGVLVRPLPLIFTAFLHQSRLLTSLELFEGQYSLVSSSGEELQTPLLIEHLESLLPQGVEPLVLDIPSTSESSSWILRHQAVRYFLFETELRGRHRMSGTIVRLTVPLHPSVGFHDSKTLHCPETDEFSSPHRPWLSSGFRYLPVSRGCLMSQKKLDWVSAILFEANSADFDKVSALPARDQMDTW